MLNEPTIFQSSAWLKFQGTLPGRKAGLLEGLYWTVMPTIMGQHYLFINRPQNKSQIANLLPQIIALAKAEKCIYIKIEPNWEREAIEPLYALGFHQSPFHIQPDCTLYLDLRQDETDLLKQMKPKGRYNIKIATKHEINYQCFDEKHPEIEIALHAFYNLLATTAQRDKFGIHSQSYYRKFIQALYPYSKLYLAYYQGEAIAGLIAIFYDTQAIYYYGASDTKQRHTMATYGLQWHVIGEARKAGMRTYDFLGIAPPNSADNHPWRGVTDFKQKFGGHIYHYPGTFHYSLAPIRYFLLHTLKKARYELKKHR